MSIIDKFSKTSFPILITGETGTGKTTLAHSFHQKSNRALMPFLGININAIPNELFESTLFGHRKGSFTGAITEHQGLCESIGSGTLFIDEIGDLTLPMQTKLLQLIDQKIFFPVGSNHSKPFNGRLIFATHKHLEELVELNLFRKDLYYRIRFLQHKLRPLREQRNEIEMVIDKILGTDLCIKTKSALLNYSWPGNYRELHQTLEFMKVASTGGSIDNLCLPAWISPSDTYHSVNFEDNDYQDSLEHFERELLNKALCKTKGRINQTARELNISKTTLLSKIRKYQINVFEIKYQLNKKAA